MAITRTDIDEVFEDGVAVSSTQRVVDITAPSVEFDIHTKARLALNVNSVYIAKVSPSNAEVAAQVKALTRECSGLIRLLIGADLLVENTDT